MRIALIEQPTRSRGWFVRPCPSTGAVTRTAPNRAVRGARRVAPRVPPFSSPQGLEGENAYAIDTNVTW